MHTYQAGNGKLIDRIASSEIIGSVMRGGMQIGALPQNEKVADVDYILFKNMQEFDYWEHAPHRCAIRGDIEFHCKFGGLYTISADMKLKEDSYFQEVKKPDDNRWYIVGATREKLAHIYELSPPADSQHHPF
jgi:hypothetical protein